MQRRAGPGCAAEVQTSKGSPKQRLGWETVQETPGGISSFGVYVCVCVLAWGAAKAERTTITFPFPTWRRVPDRTLRTARTYSISFAAAASRT